MTPSRLGRYEIRGVLGSGAMGTVYEAWDPALSRGVALKVIHGAQLGVRDTERFRREAQTLARLVHAHIVAVYDLGTEHDTPYIVMELVRGHTLARELAEGFSRSAADKVRLAAQLCDALAFANAAGVIHRDVKPANVLITTEGIAKLADFGVARLQDSSLTGSAHLVGTPAYLAPEAFSGAELDGRADVYGIAATLFEWLCGARPHDAENLAALMAKVLSLDAPDIRQYWPGCPAALAECLRRGLARDRGERHQSAKDFGQALRAISFEDGSTIDGATILIEAPAERRLTPRGHRMVWAAAAVTAIVGLIFLAMRINLPTAPATQVAAEAVALTTTPPPAPSADVVGSDSPAPVAERVETPVTPRRGATAAQSPATSASGTPAATPSEPIEDEIALPPPSIPIGTPLIVTVRSELLTDRTVRGQPFDATLAEPLVWTGREIAAAGSPVRGLVDAVIAASPARPPGVQLSLLSLEIGGQRIRVRTARYETSFFNWADYGRAQPAFTTLTFKLVEPLRLQPGTH